MRVIAIVLAAAVAVCAGWPATANAQKRVALVIGNSAYQHSPKLDNPKNDATDMAAALKKLGFVVVEGFDLDKTGFDRKVRDFATALRGAAVGVLFYAGHGLQVGGTNYLMPIDAKGESAGALDFEMVRLDLLHRTMEREAQTNIIFLDACRDNPLARDLARSLGTRSTDVGRGLAAVESGIGTLISFSTQPGNVALDGAGRNSPYAGALVRQLATANDDLSAMLIAVRNDVMKDTQRRQVPWEHSALTGRFYFGAPPLAAPPPTSAPQPQLSEAERAWNLAKDTRSIAVLEAFVSRYKDTFHADMARVRIDELKREQAAVAAPAPRSTPAAPPAAPAAPAAIPANAANRFGAIAYSASTGAQGWAYDYATREAAESAAVANCQQHAGDCAVPIWFQNACGALAVGPTGWGSGWGVTRALAETYALQVCGQNSQSCNVQRWVCTSK